MAKKQTGKASKQQARVGFAKTLCCLTILTSVAVILWGGISHGVRTSKMIYTCMVVSAVLGFAFRLVIGAVSSFEEIDGG